MSAHSASLPQSSGCGCHDLWVVATTAFGLRLPQSSGCGRHDLWVVAITAFGLWLRQLSGCGCDGFRAVAGVWVLGSGLISI